MSNPHWTYTKPRGADTAAAASDVRSGIPIGAAASRHGVTVAQIRAALNRKPRTQGRRK